MSRRVSTLSFSLTMGLLVMASTGAFAQNSNQGKGDQQGQEQETGGTIGAYTARILTDAIKALNMNDYKGAQAKLATLKLDKLSPYELSRVEEIMAQISNGEGDNVATREHLEKAVAAGGLNPQEVQQVKYQIASLYIVDGKYKEGAAALEDWFKTEPMPGSAAYYMLAVAYYQLNPKDDRAFRAAKKCVELMDTPNTGWMELLLAMYVERQDFKDAIPLSERMIAVDPKNKNYWVSLSSYYQASNQYDQALAALQTAYNGGFLTDESEYRRLAQMAAYNGAPYRCGQILDKAIADKKIKPTSDDFATLSNCWISARDFKKSIPPLERAADLSDKGDLYVRLAQVHMQSNEWADAGEALQKALTKGKLEDPPNAQLLMGVVLYSQGKFTESVPYFERASKASRYHDTANSYLQAIASKNKGS
jgi:tetratricopeptide (TPR) repeat protein